MKTLQEILDWSEVWAPLIPLAIYFFIKPKSKWVKPVFIYLVVAFIFAVAIDIILYRRKLGLNDWFQNNLWWWYDIDPVTGNKVFKNLIFYTLTSVTRFLMFTWFFQFFFTSLKKISVYITWIFLVVLLINFIFFKSIKDFSSLAMTLETGILLFYCLRYFHNINRDDEVTSPLSLSHYWVVMGLALYSAINFMLFLFYEFLMSAYKEYATEIWNFHNISLIVLCLLLGVSFIKSRMNKEDG